VKTPNGPDRFTSGNSRPFAPIDVAGALVDIALPSPATRLAGIDIAGFRGRADSSVVLQVIPYPAVTMFIDFAGALRFDDARGVSKQGSVIAGIAPGRVRASGSGRDVDCLQVRMSPVTAHRVLGSAELHGSVATLEDLWGRDGSRIQERLQAAKTWGERFAITNSALAGQIDIHRSVDPEVAFIWARMVMGRGQVRVERLATDVGWSRKRLWSRFVGQVGITPSKAAKLIRFDYAAHRLAAGDSPAVVAAESGFVDQSHLCRDAVAFSGLTPTAIANAAWLAVDSVAWPAAEHGLQS